MAKRIITFGEIMLRLAPEGYYRFVQVENQRLRHHCLRAYIKRYKREKKVMPECPCWTIPLAGENFTQAVFAGLVNVMRYKRSC